MAQLERGQPPPTRQRCLRTAPPKRKALSNTPIWQTVAASRQNAGRALLSYATPCVLREQPRSSWLGTLYEAVAAVAVLENAAKASARRRRAASARRDAPWSAHNPGQRPLPLLDSPQPPRFHALAQALPSDLFQSRRHVAYCTLIFGPPSSIIRVTTWYAHMHAQARREWSLMSY